MATTNYKVKRAPRKKAAPTAQIHNQQLISSLDASTPRIITADGTGIAQPDIILPKGTRSTNPELLGEVRGNRVILSDSIRSIQDPVWPSPTIVAHYIQTMTIDDNNKWREKRARYASNERASGIHASGVINVLMRRMSSAFKPEDELPNKLTQGLAIEKHYFGFQWHANTIYQPGPLEVNDIHLSPDGLTPTMDPSLLRTFPGMPWIQFQPYMLEEMKSTYYSSAKVRDGGLIRNIEFRAWLYQMAMYLRALGHFPKPYDLWMQTVYGKPFLSRLTVWWVMDDYSYRGFPPVCECWILSWDWHAIHNFWNNLVLPNAHYAAPEKH